jgi:hypothetical protein
MLVISSDILFQIKKTYLMTKNHETMNTSEVFFFSDGETKQNVPANKKFLYTKQAKSAKISTIAQTKSTKNKVLKMISHVFCCKVFKRCRFVATVKQKNVHFKQQRRKENKKQSASRKSSPL